MTHSRPRTLSPSSLRITRSTPWVAGCCGPMLMTSSLASRNGFSGASRSSGESVFGSVIASFEPCFFSLAALNSQVDLHPFVVLLQDAVVFAQRMPLPAVGQQNAFHVGMSVELDAKHVVDFAFQPVRGGPYGYRAGNAVSISDLHFYPNSFVASERIEHPDHVEWLLALGIVRRGDVHAVVKLFLISQNLEDFRNQRSIHDHVVLTEVSQRVDAGTVLALQLGNQGRIPWCGYGTCRLRCSRMRCCRRRSFRRSRGRCDGRFWGTGWRGRRRGLLGCGLVGRNLCIRLNRAGGSCLHAPGTCGLIRRRLRRTFRRRGRRRFGFVRHSSRTRKPPAWAALRRTLTSISLRIRCQRC